MSSPLLMLMEEIDPTAVSYALCERIIERDARITHFAQKGWWRVRIKSRRFEAQTRPAAVHAAARDLQRRLLADLKGGWIRRSDFDRWKRRTLKLYPENSREGKAVMPDAKNCTCRVPRSNASSPIGSEQ